MKIKDIDGSEYNTHKSIKDIIEMTEHDWVDHLRWLKIELIKDPLKRQMFRRNETIKKIKKCTNAE